MSRFFLAALPAVGLGLGALLCPGPARAAGSEAEAKATAAAANCKPGKVEVMRQLTGGNGETVYKVSCTDLKEAFVLVSCRMRLCSLIR